MEGGLKFTLDRLQLFTDRRLTNREKYPSYEIAEHDLYHDCL